MTSTRINSLWETLATGARRHSAIASMTKQSCSAPSFPPFRPFRFQYEYDFGDSLKHEILVENHRESEQGHRDPRCLDSELASPPKESGGAWGCYDALEDCQHIKNMWQSCLTCPPDFDPEAFHPVAATKAMWKFFRRTF